MRIFFLIFILVVLLNFIYFFEASSSLPVCRTHPINSRFVDGNDKASLPNQKWRFIHGHDWTSEDEEG
jgi:hypothetical protein